MAKANASTSLTGREGFGYEDCVAACFMIDIALPRFPIGTKAGVVIRMDWQVTDLRLTLDDLVVTLEESGQRHVMECSVNQAKQRTKNGFQGTLSRRFGHNGSIPA